MESLMTILAKLNLTDRTHASMLTSPETKARKKMLDAIDIQIAVAESDQTGEPYVRRATRYITDDATGERVKKEVPIRIRRWWWKDADGRIMLDVRYGNRRIELKAGKTAIDVGEIDNLIPTLKLLAEAVTAGELDKLLQEAKSSRKFGKGR
jgi:hypothetical protein